MSEKREAERDFLYLKYLVAMVFMVVGAIVFFIFDEYGIPYALFLVGGETTSGVITEIGFERYYYVIHFNYVDQFETMHSKINLVYVNTPLADEATLRLFAAGNPIDVTYSPTFPTIFEATRFIPTRADDFWVMLGAIACIILGAYISVLSIYQIVKHRQADRYY